MMATSKDYLQFILDQLSDLPDIRYKSMMGEYILYCRDKIVFYLCDDRLLAKVVPAAVELLPNAPMEPPYDGAKPMLLVEDVDDRSLLTRLVTAMYNQLPAPKPKKPKQKKEN